MPDTDAKNEIGASVQQIIKDAEKYGKDFHFLLIYAVVIVMMKRGISRDDAHMVFGIAWDNMAKKVGDL